MRNAREKVIVGVIVVWSCRLFILPCHYGAKAPVYLRPCVEL